MVLRRNMAETESFQRHRAPRDTSLLRELAKHPKALATVVGLTMGGTLAFYTYTTYMQKYLVNTAGFSKADSTLISAATLFLYMLLQHVIGALPDRIGRRQILIAFGVLGTALTVPILSPPGHIKTFWGAFWLIR